MKQRIDSFFFLCLSVLFFNFIPFSEGLLAAMSVDFGSQYMKIALVKPGVPMEIVLNRESRRKTPNIIAFKNGERLFGDEAISQLTRQPQNSFPYLLDLLGKKIDNPVVKLYQERFPYVKLSADDSRNSIIFHVGDTTYNIETLIAMLLQQAQSFTEEFAGQPVKDVVIAVPAFFNQAERRAMITAAKIAGLNVLKLLNQHSAAGLNYGIFRRKEINNEPKTLLIYDMGASSTVASIVQYNLVKDEKLKEMVPVMSTIGIGYDRTLGGIEMTLRLHNFLIHEFKRSGKTKNDITKSARSLTKMFREAERVKQVLSANAEHYAQVESVFEDLDFRLHITRDQFEDLISDLDEKYTKPIDDALRMAELNVNQVDQVVLMGASTRVPRVQAKLQKYFGKKELGKFLNTDEAIALGAVYQAADLSKGFKVKNFIVKELQIFPIEVNFLSSSETRLVRRPIFGYKTFYPTTKKVLSFTSFKKDFSFFVNYGELSHFNQHQLSEYGSLNVSDVELVGITNAVENELGKEGAVFKGVKAHFNIDLSGIVTIDGAEVLIEQMPVKEESTFASIAGKISGLFASSKKEEQEKTGESAEMGEGENSNSDKSQEDKEEPVKDEANKTVIDKTLNLTANATKEAEKINGTETDKLVQKSKVIKIPVKLDIKQLDLIPLGDSEVESARGRLKIFEKQEKEKADREAAHNSIESLIYDLTDKLEQQEFQKFMKDDERTNIVEEVNRIRNWVEEEVNLNTKTSEFVEQRKKLDSLLKPVNFRIKEEKERPVAIADLMTLINKTEIFFALAQNLSESNIFTEVELSTLTRVFNETKNWFEEVNKTQSALKPVDVQPYKVDDIYEKGKELNRELMYLLNKLKFATPKLKKPDNATESNPDDIIKDTNQTVPETKVEEVKEVVVEEGREGLSEEKNESNVDFEFSNAAKVNDSVAHDTSEL